MTDGQKRELVHALDAAQQLVRDLENRIVKIREEVLVDLYGRNEGPVGYRVPKLTSKRRNPIPPVRDPQAV